ncbi:hypothetical protein JXM67_11415 [candidate division WOR-3 bacterium]|nr:hypothetical protein [candidate division WOR-3 bacterium]
MKTNLSMLARHAAGNPKGVLLLLVVSGTLFAKSLDPTVDPVNEYEVTLKEKSDAFEAFYPVCDAYNDHLSIYHPDAETLELVQPIHPDVSEDFYEGKPDESHWTVLDRELDGLHTNMFSLQAHYNRHLGEYHPGVDTARDLVYDLGFPDVEMSRREYISRKIYQLDVMIAKLKQAIDAHIEYHSDPTILDREPVEPVQPEPRDEPEVFPPPETQPEDISTPDLDAAEASESPAADSAKVEALMGQFAEVYNAFLKLKARYNDHLGAASSVVPYLASCSRKSLKPDWPPAQRSAEKRLEALLEKKDALWDCLLDFQKVYNEHLSICGQGEEVNVVPDPDDFPDFRTPDMFVIVGSWIDVLCLWTNSLKKIFDRHYDFMVAHEPCVTQQEDEFIATEIIDDWETRAESLWNSILTCREEYNLHLADEHLLEFEEAETYRAFCEVDMLPQSDEKDTLSDNERYESLKSRLVIFYTCLEDFKDRFNEHAQDLHSGDAVAELRYPALDPPSGIDYVEAMLDLIEDHIVRLNKAYEIHNIYHEE